MRIKEYEAIVKKIDNGDANAVKDALQFLSKTLLGVWGNVPLGDYRKDTYDASSFASRLLYRIDSGAISIVPGRHTQVEDDDFITRSSYEQHWENKGRQFFEDLAKNIREREAGGEVKGVEEGIQKVKQERAILERKAAAFDEIAGEIIGLYRAVNTVRACVDGDCDQYKVHLAMIDAMFSLGVVAQIIAKTKEDAA